MVWAFEGACWSVDPPVTPVTNKSAISVWWDPNIRKWQGKWVVITGCNPRTREFGSDVEFSFLGNKVSARVPIDDLLLTRRSSTNVKWHAYTRRMPFSYPPYTSTLPVDVAPNMYETGMQPVPWMVKNTETLPEISNVSIKPAILWPPNHKMVDIAVQYKATDNCALSSPICWLNVTSNEPVNGTGDGDTAPDWEIINPNLARLRAERAGSGSGRVYTVTINCMNVEGNISTETVEVHVPRDQGKK